MKNQPTKLLRGGVVAVTLLALASAVPAFAADPSPAGKAADPAKAETKKGGQTAAAAALSDDDKDFMMQAGKDGMREVHMGQMGQKQGKSAEVKRIAGMIVSDHTKANNQLMALARKKGVTLDTKHDMDKIDDDDFDKEWLEMMVKDHEKDIAAFEKASKNATDPDVKNFASKTLPVLKKHLKAVKDAQGKMEKKAS